MIHLLPGLLACLLAILTFKRLDPFARLIAVQIVLACLVELVGLQLKLNGQKNAWLYNCYMPVECSLLFIATLLKFKGRLRTLFSLLLAAYWVCWICEIYLHSVHSLAVKTYVTGSIILLVSYFFVLYRSALSPYSILSQGRFWFAIGVILFFGCNIPVFSMYDYIVEHSNQHQLTLLAALMKLFSHFRDLCTTIGFIVVFREAKKNHLNPEPDAE